MAKSMGPGKKTPKATTVVPSYTCPYCGKLKKETEFYVSSDPLIITGRVVMCKTCCEKIARRYNAASDNFGDCSQDSICQVLERIDKPFIQTIWDASVNETMDASLKQPKSNVWAAYIKNVQMNQYRTMRWRDGDLFKKDGEASVEVESVTPTPEALEEYQKNQREVIRLLGYDPFEKESIEDQPLLYAQLIGYIDTNGDNEDMTRVLDSIEIVRGYLQLQKLNDMSAKAFANLAKTGQSGEIKSYMDTKKKVADVISQLAEQSCISSKHNKNASKGENTFTGKIKKLKELNLREAELNAFDIETSEGMRRVADISNASILKQLHLDENDYTEMISEQREMVVKLQRIADENAEKARILLRENIDLKQYLSDMGINIEELCTKDTILYQEEGNDDE